MDLQNAILHIRQLSRNVTEIQGFQFNYRNDFVRLARNTQAGKINLSTNSVRFILANILDNNGIPRNLNYAGYFELIVIGDFENGVRLVEEVAEALTNFYIKTEILPRIRPINENYLSENMDKYEELIRKTMKIYDREKNIF